MSQEDADPNDPSTYGLDMTKRDFLKVLGGGAAVIGSASALDDDGDTGTLNAGRMALSQAYKVASDERTWWQGPDSAKDGLLGLQNGDRYSATDTQLEYYYDGGWVALGVGTSGDKAPASHFQSLSTESATVAERPIRSQEARTLYIDEQNGSDDNDGESAADAFASWTRAEKEIPYFCHHQHTIRIIGDLSERIHLENRNVQKEAGGRGVLITGDTNTPSNHEIPGARVNGCSGRVELHHLRVTSETIFVRRTSSCEIIDCEPRNSGGKGIQANESVVIVSNCDFGTDVCSECIWGNVSRIYSNTNEGSGTGFGLVATRNTSIGKNGTQPTGGTSNESTLQGSVIR